MSILAALAVGAFVGLVYGVGEHSLLFGLKVSLLTAGAAFVFGNLF